MIQTFDNLQQHNLELVRMAAAELDLLTYEYTDGVLSKDEYRSSVYEILDGQYAKDFYHDSVQRAECLKQFQQLMVIVKHTTDI